MRNVKIKCWVCSDSQREGQVYRHKWKICPNCNGKGWLELPLLEESDLKAAIEKGVNDMAQTLRKEFKAKDEIQEESQEAEEETVQE